MINAGIILGWRRAWGAGTCWQDRILGWMVDFAIQRSIHEHLIPLNCRCGFKLVHCKRALKLWSLHRTRGDNISNLPMLKNLQFFTFPLRWNSIHYFSAALWRRGNGLVSLKTRVSLWRQHRLIPQAPRETTFLYSMCSLSYSISTTGTSWTSSPRSSFAWRARQLEEWSIHIFPTLIYILANFRNFAALLGLLVRINLPVGTFSIVVISGD